MLYTNTAIEYRDRHASAIQPVAVGLAGGADDFSERRNWLEAERAIDDVLADSFPASDPPSWNAGVSRPEPVSLRCDDRATLIRTDRCRDGACAWLVIDVSRRTLGERTFVDAMISLAGAAGIALLVPFAILLIGTASGADRSGSARSESAGSSASSLGKPGQVAGWIQESALIRD